MVGVEGGDGQDAGGGGVPGDGAGAAKGAVGAAVAATAAAKGLGGTPRRARAPATRGRPVVAAPVALRRPVRPARGRGRGVDDLLGRHGRKVAVHLGFEADAGAASAKDAGRPVDDRRSCVAAAVRGHHRPPLLRVRVDGRADRGRVAQDIHAHDDDESEKRKERRGA